jgi:tRNA/tmRNA/rRNA uracil-C5-methylase (TrmA/RlmC/RlmD family)
MVVLVINARKLPDCKGLVEKLTAQGVTTVLLNKNSARGNTIFSDDFEILYGNGCILEKIGDIEYMLSAPSFFQVNPSYTMLRLRCFGGQIFWTRTRERGVSPSTRQGLFHGSWA